MKRWFLFMILVALASGVFALEGVSPGSYEVDFEPMLEKDFVFDFVLDGREDLFVEGDLAKYVVLDREEIVGKESVVASLKLPENLDSFGVSEVWVVAGKVRGLIKINVPYPDSFVNLELSAPNVNQGDIVVIGLNVGNLGKDFVLVGGRIDIYEGDGRDMLIDSFDLEERWVGVSDVENSEFYFDSSNYSAGDYVAVASVYYDGGSVEQENVFRLGEFRARLVNYTKEFYGDSVNKFEVEVENLWNNRMDEVYVEINVVGFDSDFDSGIVSLGPWEKRTLQMFFNAEDISENVNAEIILHYGDEADREVVVFEYLEGFDWRSLVVAVLVLGICGFLFWRIRRFF